MKQAAAHQYIDRDSSEIRTEQLYGDRIVTFLYATVRESAPRLFRALTSPRLSDLLAWCNYDWPGALNLPLRRDFLRCLAIDLGECVDPPAELNTARKIFERRIRYWETRPMDEASGAVVSPADARILVGTLTESSALFLKGKFFNLAELLGPDRELWLAAFRDGDFAIFRLTPDKYHYNHVPVTGRVVDFYELDGECHACNPSAVIALATPHSKNRRTVTIIDTDIPGGTGVGYVAMIEVVALMIGNISQRYSRHRYDAPAPIRPGMILEKGQPKSLYRPGSSTDVLLFERDRVRFCADLLANQRHAGASSRYSLGFGGKLVETDVKVRSTIAHARTGTSLAGNGGL